MIGNQKRGSEHYRWKGGKRKHAAGYVLLKQIGHPRADRHGYVYEHILVAEHALGRFLPVTARVHHVNEKKDDNKNTNLVICENDAYHHLLHARARALRACGSVDKVKCYVCKQWDNSEASDMTRREYAHGSYHRSCVAKIALEKYHKKKEVK